MLRLTVLQNGTTREISVESPRLLSEILADNGYFVPHPCGGRGTCKKCTVLLNGSPVLACRTMLSGDGEVILPEKENLVSVTAGAETGRLTERVCLCLDIGTTTLALALVSLDENAVIRTVTAPNPQRVFGADVISRIAHCAKNGPESLQNVLLERIKELTFRLLSPFALSSVETMYVAGNTTMLHLFFGENCASLGVAPYTPAFLDFRTVPGEDLGFFQVNTVTALPGISAFVGADIVAGINAVGMPPSGKYRILLDLGTNAEIALYNERRILCTAAAAGPCFEGANISCGMSASDGAVCAVSPQGDVTVLGGGEAKGLCATGLVDAVARAVREEDIDETGFLEEDPLPLCPGVELTGKDIREFQLAKSAVRAGLECLLHQAGISYDAVDGLYVAGGFSAGLNVKSAAFVGLIPEELQEIFHGVNNASLSGTVQYACSGSLPLPLSSAEAVDLSGEKLFSDLFMEYMMF